MFVNKNSYAHHGVSKFKKKLQNNLKTDQKINQDEPRKRQVSPGTLCTRDDDFDIEEFIKVNNTSLVGHIERVRRERGREDEGSENSGGYSNSSSY